MNSQNPRYISDVDALIESTGLSEVLAAYGKTPPRQDQGEHRMECVFSDDCATSKYGQLTVKLDSPARRIYCHSCEVKGNLLTLVWGLEHGCPPTGGKLRGQEFREAVELLRSISSISSGVRTTASHTLGLSEVSRTAEDQSTSRQRNTPLRRSENPRAREIVNLYQQLVADPSAMPPAAAKYFRSRPWLTPEVARRWKMGYLPKSAKGLMRGKIVYTFESEAGEILSYFGRDPEFEAKLVRWKNSDADETKRPPKHRFVKGFQRGQELYGQNGTSRLKEERIKPSLESIGMVVVEGPNDVIRLDCLDVAAVGLCSNRATDSQVAKLTRFAKVVSGGKILLMPDTDPEGETGCKELLWRLAQDHDLSVRVGWSSESHDGRFEDRQPESLSPDEWRKFVGR